ncbi:F420-0:gamma-glutamyl ligase [Cryobacterium mesophilum]|uniref:F420-0--gamma-glutamyl ligase n=1 Tax=Terrimesophilobacter mesophilus TaxID=433647 RepID=A0A4R8V8F8_9MICO|nr:coenzyme F420-0:L-glutamate ligase [Terrimesophilobacter mesophilus]MBB5631819.1 F420-0:gamma-glutamyl ligase [Terrimesophilobacter mesophilus]TFB78735.1 F420-0--gamma-glutamyl ligase [Terrimesophilobacter mesophilus]
MAAKANEGKALEVEVDGVRFLRIPITTRLVGPQDDIVEIVTTYAPGQLEAGDRLFITEKIVAITQGRAYPVDSITPRPLAVRLSKYVTKTPGGIGLGMPETMEMALRECGTVRILFAAAVAAVTKLFGARGAFYVVAGPKARGIDGPTSGTIPPYNSHVVLAPDKPGEVARRLKSALRPDIDVLIVDINDFGGNVLGSTLRSSDNRLVERVLADNPLGQGRQSTPLGIIRRA